jgi:hypothetical protein
MPSFDDKTMQKCFWCTAIDETGIFCPPDVSRVMIVLSIDSLSHFFLAEKELPLPSDQLNDAQNQRMFKTREFFAFHARDSL